MGLVKSNAPASSNADGLAEGPMVARTAIAAEPVPPRLASAGASAEMLCGDLKLDDFLSLRAAVISGAVDFADPAVQQRMVGCFEKGDAAMRAQVTNVLKALSVDLSPLLQCLVSHPDPHLRIQGISLLEFRRSSDVESYLLAVVEQETDVQVCGAALDLLCEVGTEAALEPLERLKLRFASEAYIQFAVALALQRIRGI